MRALVHKSAMAAHRGEWFWRTRCRCATRLDNRDGFGWRATQPEALAAALAHLAAHHPKEDQT